MADKDKKNHKKNKTVTSRTGRMMKLAGMTASVATRYATSKVARVFSSEEKAAERQGRDYEKMASQIAETLGELKGAVMKVGQIASQTQDFLPRELSQALQKLQKEAPPMPYSVIADQIVKELGQPPEKLYRSFSEVPYAAASIGQVHEAVTHDGRSVIVKVQYPGVDLSVDSDLRQLRTTLKLGGLLKIPKDSVDQLFEEIRVRLHEELDYQNEATNIQCFANFHRDDQKVLIPAVCETLSSRRVLTLEKIEGDHISQVEGSPAYSQEIRNEIGHRIFKTMADQLFLYQCIHGDPHAGNFAFRPDGSLIMYDFGCVKKLKPEIVEAYRRTLLAALAEDYELLDECLIDLGVRVEGKPAVDQAYYAAWRDIFIVPFENAEKRFDFGRSDLHVQVARNAHTVFQHIDAFKPPVDTIFIDRLIAGHYWMMKRLGVQAAFRAELNRYLNEGQPEKAQGH